MDLPLIPALVLSLFHISYFVCSDKPNLWWERTLKDLTGAISSKASCIAVLNKSTLPSRSLQFRISFQSLLASVSLHFSMVKFFILLLLMSLVFIFPVCKCKPFSSVLQHHSHISVTICVLLTKVNLRSSYLTSKINKIASWTDDVIKKRKYQRGDP